MAQGSQALAELPKPAMDSIQPFHGHAQGTPVVETTLYEAPQQQQRSSQAAIAWEPPEPGRGEADGAGKAGVSGKGGDAVSGKGESGGRSVAVEALQDFDPCQGTMELERWPIKGVAQMMGKCWRNPVTGEIVLRPEHQFFPDFSVVDLYRRAELPTSLAELKDDPYLFKPVVLSYRTWIYHEGIRSPTNDSVDGSGGDSMVRKALDAFCIDVDINAGRSSSICWFAPLFMAAGLTGDDILALAAACVAATVLLLSFAANRSFLSLYRVERFLTMPVRLFFFIYVCTRFHTKDVLAIFGFLACFLAILIDAYFGDYRYFTAYRWHCSYDIVKEFPKRVYICKRAGAPEMAMGANDRYVDEAVAGFATWEPTNVLIADIGGLLVELQPMRPEDWIAAKEEFFRRAKQAALKGSANRESEAVPYVGLDLFGPPGGQGGDFMDDKEMKLYEAHLKLISEGQPLKAARITVEDL